MTKIEKVKALQDELDYRTDVDVEKTAEQLIIAGKFEEALNVLNSIDDEKAKERLAHVM